MSQSITDTLKEHIGNAIDDHASKDSIEWDIVATMHPQSQQLVHFIVFTAPSPILGQILQVVAGVADATHVRPEQLVEIVQNAAETIRNQRSELLAQGPS